MTKLPYERPIIQKITSGVTDKFGMTPHVKTITHIDGVYVKDIIKKYGSPVYVISENTLADTFNEAKTTFENRYPNVKFAWSYKTNYLDAVCRLYHKLGSWAEVVSRFEYDKALANDVPGNKIIFNGPYKSIDDLKLAVENDSLIHIDHFDELYNLIQLSSSLNLTPKVAIRINMDAGIYPQWDRFGFNLENGEAWNAINKIMISKKLELVGLHTHLGTYIMTPAPYATAISKLAELMFTILKKYNHTLNYIDIGGGFASKNTLKGSYLPGSDTCPTFDQYAEAITNALITSSIPPDSLPTLFLETGRALIDDAGYLLGSVVANKRLADGSRSTILDIGVNTLFTSFWYEHDIYPAQITSQKVEDTTLYGPLCMNIDVIRGAIQFPPLKKGDHIVIKRIGAYNMTQWMQFITLRPKVLLIDLNNNIHVIRENETNEVFNSLEKIPDYLKTID